MSFRSWWSRDCSPVQNISKHQPVIPHLIKSDFIKIPAFPLSALQGCPEKNGFIPGFPGTSELFLLRKAINGAEQALNEKKAAEKKADEKRAEESKNEETTIADEKEYVQITAGSMEELIDKVSSYAYENSERNVLTESEKSVGQKFDFRG